MEADADAAGSSADFISRAFDIAQSEEGFVDLSGDPVLHRRLPPDCVDFLLETMGRAGSWLQGLDLRDNEMGDVIGLRLATVGLQQCASLRHLSLKQNCLTAAAVDLLAAQGFEYCPALECLELDHNPFGDEGAIALARGLAACPLLTSLPLTSCGIGPAGACELARALRHCPKLTALRVGLNEIGDAGLEAIATDALPNLANLTLLELSNTGIGNRGLSALALRGLAGCPRLSVLLLDGNAIGDTGCGVFATEGLPHVPLLTRLALHNNIIGDPGARQVRSRACLLPGRRLLSTRLYPACRLRAACLPPACHRAATPRPLTRPRSSARPPRPAAVSQLAAEGLQHCELLESLLLEMNSFDATGAEAVALAVNEYLPNLRELTGVQLSEHLVALQLPGTLLNATTHQILRVMRARLDAEGDMDGSGGGGGGGGASPRPMSPQLRRHSVVERRFLAAASSSDPYQRVPWRRAKMTLVGQGRCGKTSLLKALLSLEFEEEEPSTLGMSLGTIFAPNSAADGDWDERHYHMSETDMAVYQAMMDTMDDLTDTVTYAERVASEADGAAPNPWLSDERQRAYSAPAGAPRIAEHIDVVVAGGPPAQRSLSSPPVPPRPSPGRSPSPVDELFAIDEGAADGSSEDGEASRRTLDNRSSQDYTEIATGGAACAAQEQQRPMVRRLSHTFVSRNPKGAPLVFSVWDFAGQEVFETLHHVFLTRFGVYLLCFSLVELTPSLSTPQRMANAKRSVAFWLNSVRVHANGSPCFLVGTHADVVPSDEDHVAVHLLLEGLAEGGVSRRVVPDAARRCCFWPVDCTRRSPGAEEDVARLRQAIIEAAEADRVDVGHRSGVGYIDLKVPLCWRRAYDAMRRAGGPYLKLQQAKELAERCGADGGDAEMDEMLTFMHEVGLLVRFSAVSLRDYVILEPQWLIDALCVIICDSKLHLPDLLLDNPELQERRAGELSAFHGSGILSTDLLFELWREYTDEKDFLLSIMLNLWLLGDVGRMKGTTERRFLVPSLLPKFSGPGGDAGAGVASAAAKGAFSIVFSDPSLPSPVFRRLLCRCAEVSSEVLDSRAASPAVEFPDPRNLVLCFSHAQRFLLRVDEAQRRIVVTLLNLREADEVLDTVCQMVDDIGAVFMRRMGGYKVQLGIVLEGRNTWSWYDLERAETAIELGLESFAPLDEAPDTQLLCRSLRHWFPEQDEMRVRAAFRDMKDGAVDLSLRSPPSEPMEEDVLEQLLKYLQAAGQELLSLDLSNNDLGRGGAFAVAKALIEAAPRLEALRLDGMAVDLPTRRTIAQGVAAGRLSRLRRLDGFPLRMHLDALPILAKDRALLHAADNEEILRVLSESRSAVGTLRRYWKAYRADLISAALSGAVVYCVWRIGRILTAAAAPQEPAPMPPPRRARDATAGIVGMIAESYGGAAAAGKAVGKAFAWLREELPIAEDLAVLGMDN